MDIVQATIKARELKQLGAFTNVEVVSTEPYQYMVFAYVRTWREGEGGGIEGYLYPLALETIPHRWRMDMFQKTGEAVNMDNETEREFIDRIVQALIDLAGVKE